MEHGTLNFQLLKGEQLSRRWIRLMQIESGMNRITADRSYNRRLQDLLLVQPRTLNPEPRTLNPES